MIITNAALRASLSIKHPISNARDIVAIIKVLQNLFQAIDVPYCASMEELAGKMYASAKKALVENFVKHVRTRSP